MAIEESNVIGIRFGVKGGSSIDGDSGKRIKNELEAIAQQIDLTVDVNVKAAKSGNDAITRGVQQQKNEYIALKRELETIAKMKIKLAKMPKTEDGKQATMQGAMFENQLRDRSKAYEEHFAALEKIASAEKEGSAEIQKQLVDIKEYEATLNKIQKIQPATPVSISKLQLRAQSLYTDNGYDKVIARSWDAKKAVDDLNKDVNKLLGHQETATKEEVEALNQEFIQTETKLKRLQRETDTTGNKIKDAFGSHAIQSIANKAWLLIVVAIRKAYQNIVQINKAMTQMGIVTRATSKELADAAKTIAKSAREIGASLVDLMNSTTVYARLGYTLKQAQSLAKSTTMYANITGVNVDEATTNVTGAIKAYGLTVDQLEGTLDKFIWVGNKFAISQAEIGEAMNNAAASLKAGGNSIDEGMAILAAANASVQNISKSSTAVRTLIARINESESDLIELGEDAGDIVSRAKLDEIMRGYGVAITDVNGELRSTYDILNDLSKVWAGLSKVDKSSIGEMFAGKRQREVFESIMTNWGDAQKVMQGVASATGSLAEAQERYLDSIEGRSAQLQATWEEFSRNLLESELITSLMNFANTLGGWFSAAIEFGSGVISQTGLITLAVLALAKVVGALTDKYLNASREFSKEMVNVTAKSNALSEALQGVANSATNLIIGFMLFTTITSLIDKFSGAAANAEKVVVGALTAITAAILAFQSSNPVGWISLAITGLVTAVRGIQDIIHERSFDGFKERAQEARDAWREVKDELSEVEGQIKELETAIDELNAKGPLTFTEENDKQRLEQELAYLKQIKNAREADAAAAQKNAISSAEAALNKFDSDNNLYDLSAKSLEIYTDHKGDLAIPVAERTKILNAIKEYSELLSEFEYGNDVTLDIYFDKLYQMTDIYTMTTEGIIAAWDNIQSRVKFGDAISDLKTFVDGFTDMADITEKELNKLQNDRADVKELFEYLKTIGIWDGTTWEDLSKLIGTLRTGLSEIAAVSIKDDIEALTDKFDALSGALEDVAKNGVISLNSLKELAEKYPSILKKYFNNTADGYKIADAYKNYSDYEILQDMAVDELKEYQQKLTDTKNKIFGVREGEEGYEEAVEALNEAKEKLSQVSVDSDEYLEAEAAVRRAEAVFKGLDKDNADYETALKNLATAQDNLNTKELEWASILRDAKIEDETEKLEAYKDQLEGQLNIYKELIDIRKDLLETYKEEVDYQKELAKKQKSVADLQTQLALAQLDQSAAGQARARELENQLQEAQEDLDEYTLEKAIEDVTSALDSEYSEYESFINDLVEKTSEQIDNIAQTLENILSGIQGLTNTQFTGTEMYDLYSELKEKEKAGMTVSGDAREFMNRVSRGDYNGADQYYVGAKTALDEYKPPKSDSDTSGKEEPLDEKLKSRMHLLNGARGSGMKAGKIGDNGTVEYNGLTYSVENGGKVDELRKAAYSNRLVDGGIGSFEDGNIFFYDGGDGYERGLYGCLDGTVLKLRETDGWTNFFVGGLTQRKHLSYGRLLDDAHKAGVYHSGGFVGNLQSLKSNEEFAKLLKGEFVTTPKQMDDFMHKTLPTMMTRDAGGGATINNNSPLVEINCGSVDDDTLPKLQNLVDQAVKKIGQNMESALHRAGYKKQF